MASSYTGVIQPYLFEPHTGSQGEEEKLRVRGQKLNHVYHIYWSWTDIQASLTVSFIGLGDAALSMHQL